MPEQQRPQKPVKQVIFGLLTLAAVAVGITLNNVSYMKKLPKNIIELTDKNAGLNKIKGFEKNIELIKESVLYPSMAILKKKNETLNTKKLKSGVILSGDNTSQLQEFISAIDEHAQKLGIPTLKIKGKNKAERAKWIYRNVKEAQKSYEETGKPTIIILDDLSKIAQLKVNKSKIAKVEEYISSINRKNNPGIVWVGWTNKTKSIPCFYNNLPVLISKLAE